MEAVNESKIICESRLKKGRGLLYIPYTVSTKYLI